MAEIKYAGEYIVEECTLCTVGGLELDPSRSTCNHIYI